MDVKSAFLNGKFDTGECIYLNFPDGTNLGFKPGQALKMLKAMYGFKRSPRIWNDTWNNAMKRVGFTQPKSDGCFYFINIFGSTVNYTE